MAVCCLWSVRFIFISIVPKMLALLRFNYSFGLEFSKFGRSHVYLSTHIFNPHR